MQSSFADARRLLSANTYARRLPTYLKDTTLAMELKNYPSKDALYQVIFEVVLPSTLNAEQNPSGMDTYWEAATGPVTLP